MKRSKDRIILLFIMITFLSACVTGSAFAYGGGGGGGGGNSGNTKASDEFADEASGVKKYTRDELNDFFSSLPAGVRDLVVDKQVGKDRTKEQLEKIRHIFMEAELFQNQAESIDANAWADLVGYWTDLAVFLNDRGKDAETILSFVPAAGWMSGTAFGTIRAGIDKYSEGKGAGDIAQAMLLSVAVDKIMQVGSLKNLGSRGDKLVDMIQTADQFKHSPRVKAFLRRKGAELLGIKIGEKFTKDMIGKVLEAIANQVRSAEVQNSRPASIDGFHPSSRFR